MEGLDGSEAADAADTHRIASSVRRAITRTRRWLLDHQQDDGCWVAELEGDTILQSETIMLLAFLGEEQSDLAHRLASRLLDQQMPEGGWAMYPGGKLEISGSVKAYFALKLTGHEPSSEAMQRARRAILAHGGADAVNSFTRFYLALLGQIPYSQCPDVPPEVVLLPKWFPVNLYAVSAWSRTMIVPLSIVSAMQPVRKVDAHRGIRELFLQDPEHWPALRCPGLAGGTGLLSWDRFFRAIDGMMKWCRRKNLLPCRGRAIRAAQAWMLKRFDQSDGLGAIYPPIVWSLVALRSLGYDDSSEEVRECRRQLQALIVEDDDRSSAHVQPCKSPVWDTAITLRALAAGGLNAEHPAVNRAANWLLDKQISRPGDWSEIVAAEAGGWCFEYHNDFYPDSDDTAMVLMALAEQFDDARSGAAIPPDLRVVDDTCGESKDREAMLERTAGAIRGGLAWLLAMQNDDGGWGAFDRNNNRQFLCHVPFADHNAMIDPSTPDLTGRVVESLGKLGRKLGDPVVDRAVAYLRDTQEADGSWFGRWGVNYVYGTWQALVGLASIGVPADDPAVVAGAQWLIAHQQPCGGWGESPDTYDDPRLRGQGTVTASQTAWAVLGLLAAGMEHHPAVARGIEYLVEHQRRDGAWDETEFTGTGFPRVFYLRYHYYPIYFPLMALSQWAVTATVPVAARVAEPVCAMAREVSLCVATAAGY
ncbi:MAG: squalene--hopene cyclase [Rhodopirellula sp.]|nr:squalene--hopene cyclase [Rhodopirellula sp.]